jgi:hypothetical protein
MSEGIKHFSMTNKGLKKIAIAPRKLSHLNIAPKVVNSFQNPIYLYKRNSLMNSLNM